MTIEKAKLKALAEAARDYSGSDLIEHESRYNALACEVDPVTVLALLAEIEENAMHMRAFGEVMRSQAEQIGKLKAENEALRKDAERYRWLRDDEYLHAWADLHVCDEHRRAEVTDKAIDAAMAKEASHG